MRRAGHPRDGTAAPQDERRRSAASKTRHPRDRLVALRERHADEAVAGARIERELGDVAGREPARRHEQRIVEQRVARADREQRGRHAAQIRVERRHVRIGCRCPAGRKHLRNAAIAGGVEHQLLVAPAAARSASCRDRSSRSSGSRQQNGVSLCRSRRRNSVTAERCAPANSPPIESFDVPKRLAPSRTTQSAAASQSSGPAG